MVIENLFLILGADCKIGLIIVEEGRYSAYKKRVTENSLNHPTFCIELACIVTSQSGHARL
ncbi:hypothetical protein C9J12_06050 [Photobacterium frigidiphilum]|uniref:Uncharacterized protein n=1 Tax=Photobacterium frigidiphilum TaxID=264736 RepID=A0A2T3JMM8_9GAMM|nr:hypothetical protein C9J12_06050 [Photobacterium frigidiphilum]